MVSAKHREPTVVGSRHGMVGAIIRPEVRQRRQIAVDPHGLDKVLNRLLVGFGVAHRRSPMDTTSFRLDSF